MFVGMRALFFDIGLLTLIGASDDFIHIRCLFEVSKEEDDGHEGEGEDNAHDRIEVALH